MNQCADTTIPEYSYATLNKNREQSSMPTRIHLAHIWFFCFCFVFLHNAVDPNNEIYLFTSQTRQQKFCSFNLLRFHLDYSFECSFEHYTSQRPEYYYAMGRKKSYPNVFRRFYSSNFDQKMIYFVPFAQ